MPREIQPGVEIGIPCRHCLNAFIPYAVTEGKSSHSCPACASIMDVTAVLEKGRWVVKSSAGKPSGRLIRRN